MILRKNSRLVRFAYGFSDFGPPRRTTLCRFFWGAFIFTPLMWVSIIGLSAAICAILGISIYNNPWIWAVGIGSSVLSVILAFAGYQLFHTDFAQVSIKESTFVQGLKTVTSKFCPIIDIQD